MSNIVKGFQTLQGIVQYDYESLKNKPDIDGKIQTALEEYKVDVDTTLKNAGEAADAKATGDAIWLINDQMTEMPYFDEEGQDSSAILINADTLGGEPAKNFAKKSDISLLNDSIEEQLANDFLDKEYIQQNYATQAFVTNKIAEAQLEGEDIDLSGLVSIDLLNEKIDNIDYPVDSVNSKTGNIVLSAEDVGARPNTWMPSATDVGAHPNTWLPTIAQIGAAPAGYGYGETLKVIDKSAEADFEASLNAELATLADKQSKQIAFSCYGGIKDGATFFGTLTKNVNGIAILHGVTANGSQVLKRLESGVWSPFEWENPPMELGKEYRTTERWQGKAVYTKLVDCVAIVNGTKKIPHGASATQMIRCNATLSSGNWRTTIPYNDGTQTINAHADVNNILLVANFVGFNACAQIWYTKD